MAVTTGRPGVFVSESLIPLTSTPEISGQATAAFVGTHNDGPVGPTLVTSWADWRSRFGDFGSGTDLLPYAVYEFFANGGSQAYVVRAVASDSVAASLTLNDVQTTPATVLTINALAPGVMGNQIYITVTQRTPNDGRFDLYLRQGSTNAPPIEQYTDVTLDPGDPRNFVAMVGAASGSGSRYISATYTGPDSWAVENTPAAQANTPLTGGLNGTASVNLADAAKLLDAVDGILNVNLPGVSDSTTLNPLIAWAAASGSRFMVIDTPKASAVYADTVTAFKNLSPLATSSGTPLTSSSYAAVYGPWLNFRDPSAQALGATRLLPPGGAMLGLYSRSDAASGTQQSAAGVDYPIQGVVAPEIRFGSVDLDALNALGINVIRTIPGARGAVPMGVRTLAAGMPDRYIAIRRTLMYLTRLCIQSTAFAVFRPNNEDLWAQLTSILTDQLAMLQQAGILKGSTAAEAFFVRCDATNNPDNSVANGIVNIEVGVALNTPAEYIVIQIGQIASGATSTDSLAS